MLVILEITIFHSHVASYFINKRQSVDYIDNGLMFANNSSNLVLIKYAIGEI